MGGGLIQLVATGPQNNYLNGNPQITFFKNIYKRHTNFALEHFHQYSIGTFNWSNKLTFNIDRKGDLLGKCYLEFYLEFSNNGINKDIEYLKNSINEVGNLSKSLGYSLIDYIDIEIYGTTIDKHTGHWLALKSELYQNFNQRLKELLMNGPYYNAKNISDTCVLIIIPLQFWFNNNPGLYLPLVALQYHEVKINLKLNPINKILLKYNLNNKYSIDNIKIVDIKLVCEYVFLDTNERVKFAKKSHEYLIEQLQILPGEFCNNSKNSLLIPLGFNHPIKEVVWTLHSSSDTIKYGPLWSNQSNRVKDCLIQINGVDRFTKESGNYFQIIPKYYNHNGINLSKILENIFNINNKYNLSIASLDPFVYYFCLYPEKLQPSGSCNFSKIDNAVLSMNLYSINNLDDILEIRIYALGYNILKISNGMGGLLYSN